MNKKVILALVLFVLAVTGYLCYSKYFSATRIAFVNFQTISLGNIAKANDNSKIKVSEVSTDNLDKLGSYDMIFLNGMGLRIVEEQRALIQKMADKGIPVYTSMATNPANNICNLDSVQQAVIRGYLGGGGKRNYRSLLNYVRKEIDKKNYSVNEPDEVVKQPSDILYHADLKGDDELDFMTVEEYEKFLKDNGFWKEEGKRIAITGQMADATDLIAALEKRGYNVYPISSIRKLQEYLEAIRPDAVINMPHGRMGDQMVEFLKARNIPLFAPLTINGLVKDWENDPMGMFGGFLSQSVVTPEIDGAIRPMALFAEYEDNEGLHHSYAVPERLDAFVSSVDAHLNLTRKANSEKRVAIVYFKGPGQSNMVAGGMEVVPSLYNMLVRMKKEGYKVDNLPASAEALGKLIQENGSVFNTYAEGSMDDFIKRSNPELINKTDYEAWVEATLRPERYAEVVAMNGEFPGTHMVTENEELAISRIQFGNVVIMPQTAAGSGSNSFAVVHGTDQAPPHTYIAPYLWIQHGFKADALIHFGTHGSLEFTPKKQVALSSLDWPDRLVGAVPHFYIYTIGNVGEGVIAKRRSYATLQSYLTPPFLESSVRGLYRELTEKLKIYNNNPTDKAALAVKEATVKLGIHRELELDSLLTTPYTEDEILKVENFAEELATEKITGQLYSMGVPYEPARITSSVYAMATEPIAYSLMSLDKMRGKADDKAMKNKGIFTQRYLNPSKALVENLLANPALATDELVCRTAGISHEELEKARAIEKERNAPKGMMAMMMAMQASSKKDANSDRSSGIPSDMSDGKLQGDGKPQRHPKETEKKGEVSDGMRAVMRKMAEEMDSTKVKKMHDKMKGVKPSPEAMKKTEQSMGGKMPEGMAEAMKSMSQPKKEYTKEEVNFALAILEVEQTIKNVNNYRNALLQSPETELASMMNALNGGYTAPSPGGDPIANPNTIPTGRNLYSINAEATPSESAWEKGVKLAEQTIETYKNRHNGEYPRKVSYTLWAGEFIETGGATIAQVLYMLGVEPIRDSNGRVSDLRLIPSAELGRPRIDVVVQTSGQLRDLAASRLFLINRAVEMAAESKDDQFENLVYESVVEAERVLIEKGMSPKDAREVSAFRVFGGVNGNYGTGIMGMVESGDRWEDEKEIAEVYLNNMGAFYGNEKNWEAVQKYAFEAALTRTDVVIQPRQSNTWGALSLDHVYEFMGGMNLAVRNVTGKDPDAYLSDYRNRNNVRMQELKEAIGVESRTTILNPTYIKEKMKGDAASIGVIAETVRNTYGWNVMKPNVIDNELWNEIYNIYVEDKLNLGVPAHFEGHNVAAMQEITAVMIETARKGMWKATDQQLANIAQLHTDLVKRHGVSGSNFTGSNVKLQDFIVQKSSTENAAAFKGEVQKMRTANLSPEAAKNGKVMKKETSSMNNAEGEESSFNGLAVVGIVLVVFVILLVILRKKRKS